VAYIRIKGITKAKRIRNVFANKVGKVTKVELAVVCPDISVTTIEKELSDLLKEGYILKVDAGRRTAYIRNLEEG
jgi:Fic family protein